MNKRANNEFFLELQILWTKYLLTYKSQPFLNLNYFTNQLLRTKTILLDCNPTTSLVTLQ